MGLREFSTQEYKTKYFSESEQEDELRLLQLCSCVVRVIPPGQNGSNAFFVTAELPKTRRKCLLLSPNVSGPSVGSKVRISLSRVLRINLKIGVLGLGRHSI